MSPGTHEPLRIRLRQCSPLTALPHGFYGDASLHSVELDFIWYREWLFAGHECEVARTGDFLTVQVDKYPLVILRDRDDAVRAFHNTCRHRGSRICTDAHGNAPRLTCPYHGWTYRLDGSLLAARDMGDAFRATDFPLKPVHCATMAGYVFVCVAADAPDFEPLRRQAEAYLRPHQLREAKVAFESTITLNANWKLVWENNRECYHCGGNHPELLRSFPDQPTLAGPLVAGNDPQLESQWSRWEGRGLPSRYTIASNYQTRLLRLPLNDGATSLTMNGAPAVRHPLSSMIGATDTGTLMMCSYPSTWNHILADHAVTFRVLPLSATQTQLTTKWLVHRDAQDGRDYDLEALTAVWQATNAEDQRVCEENQLGALSPAYEPGPYSPIHERGAMQFTEWYRATLEARLR